MHCIKVNSMAWPTAPLAFMWDRCLVTDLLHFCQPKDNQSITCLLWTSIESWMNFLPCVCVKNENHSLFIITTLYHCSQLVFKCIHLLCLLLYLHSMTRLLIQYNSFDYILCCRMVEHCRVSLRAQHDPLSPLSEHLHNTSMSLCTDALWESRRCYNSVRMHWQIKQKAKTVVCFWQ